MKILGAHLVPVTRGTATLKDAVDSAFEEYLKDPKILFMRLVLWLVPIHFLKWFEIFNQLLVRKLKSRRINDLEKIRIMWWHVWVVVQMQSVPLQLLNDSDVKLVGVEPAGHGLDTNMHSATLTLGKPSQIHGMACYVLENEAGEPLPVHSIASGLDYPGVGPQHSFLKDLGRVEYSTATDQECLDAFMTLSRVEGIVPALESSHAVAWAIREAQNCRKKP